MSTTASRTDASMNMFSVMTIAAMVGAALALLFAPRKGSETRQQLKASYNASKRKARDTASQATTSVQQGIDKVKHKTDEVADDATDTIVEARSQIEDMSAEPKIRSKRTLPPFTPL